MSNALRTTDGGSSWTTIGINNLPDSWLDGTFTVAHTFSTSQTRVAGAFWHTGAQEECWVATSNGFLYSTMADKHFSNSKQRQH